MARDFRWPIGEPAIDACGASASGDRGLGCRSAQGESDMDDIVIVSAVRTPVGSFSGALGTLSAHALGTIALQAAFERAGVEAGDVDEVILGQVLACPTRKLHSASTRSAAPACGPWRWPRNRSAPAKAPSLRLVAWKA